MSVFRDSSFQTHSLPAAMIQGPFNTVKVRIASGNLKVFTVIGEKNKDQISQAYAGTGDGVMSGLVMKKDTVVGDYIVECVEAITNSGRFKVLAPNGDRLDDAIVAVAYSNDHLGFSIADGGADFIVGDKFTITVAAPASEEYVESLAAAVDGSEKAKAILAEDADASVAAVEALAYLTGSFAEGGLIFGAGHSRATVEEDLRDIGIIVEESVT